MILGTCRREGEGGMRREPRKARRGSRTGRENCRWTSQPQIPRQRALLWTLRLSQRKEEGDLRTLH